MDKTLLMEIIEDYEKVANIVNSRLEQLYAMVGEDHLQVAPKMEKNDIKVAIEKQRREMMGQIEEMRKQAMAQVQDSINNSTRGIDMPGVAGMSGMPGMTGMPGMPGMPGMRQPLSNRDLEEMREKLKIVKETDKDDS